MTTISSLSSLSPIIETYRAVAPDNYIQESLMNLQQGNANDRDKAVQLLLEQDRLSDDTIQTLIDITQNENEAPVVRLAVTQILVEQTAQFEIGIQAWIAALENGDEETRNAAIGLLGRQKTLPGTGIQRLVATLQHGSERVRFAAVMILSEQDTLPLPNAAIRALVVTLLDTCAEVSSAAEMTLIRQAKLFYAPIQTLIDIGWVENENPRIKRLVYNIVAEVLKNSKAFA